MLIQNKATSLLFIALTVIATTTLQGCGSNYSRSTAMNNGSNAGKAPIARATPARQTYKYNINATTKAHLNSHKHRGMDRCHNHLQATKHRMYHCHYHTQDR